MNFIKLYLFPLIIFISLSILYYNINFQKTEYDIKILLSISTFIFSIFSGFSISRQSSRYNNIRNKVSDFDGTMSSIFRQFGHLGDNYQEKVKDIIKSHYDKILEIWDYDITHKTTTITDIHNLLGESVSGKTTTPLQNAVLSRLIGTLIDLQKIRKNIIALHHERIPKFQWLLLYAFAGILIISLSIVPSQGIFYASILKGAFVTAIIFVFILLSRLNNLTFFDKTVGEESAQDVIDILKGKK